MEGLPSLYVLPALWQEHLSSQGPGVQLRGVQTPSIKPALSLNKLEETAMFLSNGWRALMSCCQPVLTSPDVSTTKLHTAVPSYRGGDDEEERCFRTQVHTYNPTECLSALRGTTSLCGRTKLPTHRWVNKVSTGQFHRHPGDTDEEGVGPSFLNQVVEGNGGSRIHQKSFRIRRPRRCRWKRFNRKAMLLSDLWCSQSEVVADEKAVVPSPPDQTDDDERDFEDTEDHSIVILPWKRTTSESEDVPDESLPLLSPVYEDELEFDSDLEDVNWVTPSPTTGGAQTAREAAPRVWVCPTSTQQADEGFEGDCHIPDEISPGERVSTKVTPSGGSPTDCCAERTEGMIFGRFAALHEKEREFTINAGGLLGGMQESGPRYLVKELKVPHDAFKQNEATLPPDRLPFVAPDLPFRHRLAATLKMPANNLTLIPQPQLSFYDAKVVQKRCIARDGNCQFRSVSYALLGTEEAHIEIRRQVAQYLKNNFTQFSWLINPDTLKGDECRMAPLDKKYKVRVPYKASKKKPLLTEDELKANWVTRLGDVRYRIWGDECTLAVIAEMYSLCVVVDQHEKDGCRATKMGSHAVQVIRPVDASSVDNLPTIFLVFDIRMQHYNVVEKVQNVSFTQK